MTLAKLETVEDVRQLIINIVLRHSPGANVNPGYPLYDLVVTPFADLIYEERQSIHVLNNINKVLPLFNSDGTLINESFKDFILNKYFITTEYNANYIFDANIYMSTKCDMVIESGSEVIVSGITYDVTPLAISSTSEDWKQEGNYYYHPIELFSATNNTVPTTDAWDITSLIYSVVDTSNSVLIKLASVFYEISAVDTSFNFEVLQNSISNRSFNNPRALKYNLKTNSGFTPASLKKYEILKLRDKYFIDSYMELFKSRTLSEEFPVGFPVNIKSSNYSKLLLDYGYEPRILPITFQYTPDVTNHEYTTQVVIIGDTASQIHSISLVNALISPTYNNNYYWRLYDDVVNSLYKFELATWDGIVTFTPVVYGEAAYGETWMELVDPTPGGDVFGQLVFDYKLDVPAFDTGLYMQLINSSIYKVTMENTSGILAPVAIFYDSVGDSNTYNLALAYYNEYISTSTDYINTSNTPCIINMSNTQYKIYGDDLGLFGKLTLSSALTSANTEDYKLYWTFQYDTTSSTHRLKIYNRNNALRNDDSLVAMAEMDATTLATITEVDSSGISGTVEVLDDVSLWPASYYDSDYDNYISFSNSVKAFSNTDLYLDLSINNGSLDQFHNKTGYMVALCSDPYAMTLSQQTLLHSDNREVGNYIMVSPYRPIVLNVYFNADYIYPFKDTATNRERFSRLWETLNTYFIDYTGNLTDVDFNSLVQDIQNETGLFLTRLDFTVATQRGHLIRGYINLKHEDTAFFNWNTVITDGPASVISIIEATIDDYYYTSLPELKESIITVEKLYKPVLSKVSI